MTDDSGTDRQAGCTDLESRAAYLGGLVKGLDVARGSDQGRVLQLAVELLGDVTREVAKLGAHADAGGQRDAVATSAPVPTAGDIPVFFACECPRCGEDIFVEADSFLVASAEGRHGVRLLEAPSLTRAESPRTAGASAGPPLEPSGPGRPEFLPREFEVTCSNCGEVFLVRQRATSPSAPTLAVGEAEAAGAGPLSPKRPARRPARPERPDRRPERVSDRRPDGPSDRRPARPAPH